MIYEAKRWGKIKNLEKITTFRNSASWQNIGKRQIQKEFGSKLNFAAKFAKFGGGGSGQCCLWLNNVKII